jgi:predicted nucleic acid-binding protein
MEGLSLPSHQVTLLIDSNQFLSLFGTPTGKKLLELLDAQKAHLFIPRIVVDEVLRNKLKKSSDFFGNLLKRLDGEAKQVAIPDHLLGIDDAKLTELRKAFVDAKDAVKNIKTLADAMLINISKSKDPVSQRLHALFDNPVEPDADELRRAEQRQAMGNPPGKPGNPLGDQIVWEQLLSRCQKADNNDVWIISADKDYGVPSGGTLLLNPLLHREIHDACRGALALHCFTDLADGLTAFARSAGETKLPSEGEREQIKQEIEFWKANTTFDEAAVMINTEDVRRRTAAVLAANSGFNYFPGGPPTQNLTLRLDEASKSSPETAQPKATSTSE